ncbi:MAG: hypothetical protein ACTSQP_07510 [Promethearchaeota archaeon]
MEKEEFLKLLPKLIREDDQVKGAIITALSGVVATKEDIREVIKEFDKRFEILEKQFEASQREWRERFESSQKEWRERFEALDKKFETSQKEWRERFEAAQNEWRERFEALDRKFEAAQKEWHERFEALDKKFEAAQNEWRERFEALDRKFEAAQNEWRERFEALDRKFEAAQKEWRERFEATQKIWNERFDASQKEWREQFDALNKRLEDLDRRFEQSQIEINKRFNSQDEKLDKTLNILKNLQKTLGKPFEQFGRNMLARILEGEGYKKVHIVPKKFIDKDYIVHSDSTEVEVDGYSDDPPVIMEITSILSDTEKVDTFLKKKKFIEKLTGKKFRGFFIAAGTELPRDILADIILKLKQENCEFLNL